ncbi:MAG TPA: protocatechuate 3,4-dioxygenase subunit alpha [Burkholderiales bacterium]
MKKLIPTGEMTLGPFFPREFAQGANDLTAVDGKRAKGEAIEISGRVTQVDGKALDNVVLEIWQADADGRYDSPDFFGWGRAATDADGVFHFKTIKPGRSAGRAAHINVLILYSGLMRQLQTALFFEDSDDPVLSAVEKSQRSLLLAKKTGPHAYRFDIRLRGEGETPFFGD